MRAVRRDGRATEEIVSHRYRNMACLAWVLAGLLMTLAPLSGCVRYRAEPIDPQRMEADFLSRRLTSPELEPLMHWYESNSES